MHSLASGKLARGHWDSEKLTSVQLKLELDWDEQLLSYTPSWKEGYCDVTEYIEIFLNVSEIFGKFIQKCTPNSKTLPNTLAPKVPPVSNNKSFENAIFSEIPCIFLLRRSQCL